MADSGDTAPLLAKPSLNSASSAPAEKAHGAKEQHEEEEKHEELKAEAKAKERRVPILSLWRFALPRERVLLALAVAASVAHGALMPLFTVLFGDVIDAFDPTEDPDALADAVAAICVKFLVLGAIAGATAYAQASLFAVTGTRQANRVREKYFTAVLRQEMAFHDATKSGEVATRLAGDVLLIQEAISDKAGVLIQYSTTFVAGFAIGFTSGWRMALVILSVVPVLAVCGAFMGTIMSRLATKGQAAYANAGAVAEEVLSAMRTVAAFGSEPNEVERYAVELEKARVENTRKGLVTGLGIGTTLLVTFCSYALAFWYGSTLVESGIMTAGDVVSTFFAIIIGAVSLGQVAPVVGTLTTGAGAAFKIFSVIDRVPDIDALAEDGIKLAKVEGRVEFRNVHFRYPSRPQVPVLNGMSFSLGAGETLALVGPSGCGKSTTVALLERFYNPSQGQIFVDGIDISTMNVASLRSHIGVVNQEPVLFGKSILENIALGNPDATRAEIEAAAKAANAYDFVTRLPAGFDTLVGARGTQLSGGQKQRIAIARAIVKNPRILLLDEATSALDSKSERAVQRALDQAAQGRTTIVIAHRLSTIAHANQIAVVRQGTIVERGVHAELMARPDSIYAQMVHLQAIKGGDAAAAAAAAAVDADDAADEHEPVAAPVSKGAATDAAALPGAASDPKKAAPVLLADDLPTKGVVSRVYRMTAPEWASITLGTFAGAVNGAVFPMFAIIFSELLSDLLTETGDDLSASVRIWSLVFVGLGGCVFVANLFQYWMFAVSGEHLTFRLRRLFFQALLRQEIGWFDDRRHSMGVLSTKLSTEVALVEGITGQRLGMVAQLAGTIVGGLLIAFFSIWQLALVILACVPVIALGGLMRVKLMTGFNERARTAYERSGHVAAEAAENVRTVAILGQERALIDAYRAELAVPDRAAMRNAHIGGATFGLTEMSSFLIMSLAFYYGSLLVSWGLADFAAMMRVIYALLFSALTIGQTAALAGDWSKAVLAAAEVFYIVDRVPPIDVTSPDGRRLERVRGDVRFEGVRFAYPERPDTTVLAGLTLAVPAGKTLALVGHSGCGKSTTVQLLQRFYAPAAGTISVDGVDISTLNLKWLRSQIGLVQQEPLLFCGTIRDNLLYGKRDATNDELVAAAIAANAHDFIIALPDGYNTLVGEKGIQLSGGQKQRVAIARALVRNPPILLLDEATSALDSQSEAVVQAALDRARRGRTCIVIAHRLSTINDADIVAVVANGVVAEMGTHDELIEKRGLYFDLVQTQTMSS